MVGPIGLDHQSPNQGWPPLSCLWTAAGLQRANKTGQEAGTIAPLTNQALMAKGRRKVAQGNPAQLR